MLNEIELRDLLDELIRNRKSVTDKICPLCGGIKESGSRCHCDNDE